MPALSFKLQFDPHIRSGRKRHTIRDKRKRQWKVGDKLYHLYRDANEELQADLQY